MKNKCFACAEPQPLTVEHIIPQAIGGKLKARLYCKECNEIFGKALDDEISKQFGWVGTLLNIKRERGKVQPYEVTDVKSGTRLLYDGKKLKRKEPIVKVTSKDGKKLDSADVTARTEEELKIICTSIQRRYDVVGGMKTFQEDSPGPTDTEHIMMIDIHYCVEQFQKLHMDFYVLSCLRMSYSHHHLTTFVSILGGLIISNLLPLIIAILDS
jgi:hypothetical protein